MSIKYLIWLTLSDANKETRPRGMKINPTAINAVIIWNHKRHKLEKKKELRIKYHKLRKKGDVDYIIKKINFEATYRCWR